MISRSRFHSIPWVFERRDTTRRAAGLARRLGFVFEAVKPLSPFVFSDIVGLETGQMKRLHATVEPNFSDLILLPLYETLGIHLCERITVGSVTDFEKRRLYAQPVHYFRHTA